MQELQVGLVGTSGYRLHCRELLSKSNQLSIFLSQKPIQ
jgi:hypothetical protein